MQKVFAIVRAIHALLQSCYYGVCFTDFLQIFKTFSISIVSRDQLSGFCLSNLFQFFIRIIHFKNHGNSRHRIKNEQGFLSLLPCFEPLFRRKFLQATLSRISNVKRRKGLFWSMTNRKSFFKSYFVFPSFKLFRFDKFKSHLKPAILHFRAPSSCTPHGVDPIQRKMRFGYDS